MRPSAHRLGTFASVLMLAALTIPGPAAVAADAYPSKPIRMLVGFAPGGGVDLVARVMAAEMQRSLGQPVTVDNRTGAGGNISIDALAKSPPDGYTILMGNTGSLAINPSLYPKLPFDLKRDIAPVALVSTSPLVILVQPTQPAKTMRELVDDAKKPGSRIDYGTGGIGSISHLAVELLKSQTGAQLLHVPYRGGSPAVIDLMAGQIQVVVDGLPLAAPFLQGKQLRALAITSPKRSPVFPDIPTTIEAGFPDFNATAWYGVAVPAGTPPAVIAALNTAINAALKNPAVRDKLAQQGSDPSGGTPEEFGRFLQQELTRWAAAVKVSGASLE